MEQHYKSNSFSDAVKKGNLNTLKNIFETHSNVHYLVEKNNLLHVACSFGHAAIVDELLIHGADANIEAPSSKRLPLHEACISGNETIVQSLLPYTKEIDAIDRDHMTAAHICAMQGHLNCLKIVVNAGANLVMFDKSKLKLCHWAAKKNHVNVLMYLHELGVDMETTCAQGKTPIHYAAQFGGLDCLKWLVTKGCDLSIGDKFQRQAVHLAALKDQLECLRFINTQGISLDVRQKDNRTPIHLAAFYGAKTCLHWMLEREPHTEAVDNKGNTALHLSAEAGYPECFFCLLTHDADPEARNARSETPMDSARRFGHPFNIEKAAKGQLVCPHCHQKKARFQWEKEHPVPQVVKAMNRSAEIAYTSPLGSYESEMRQRARHFKQMRKLAKASGTQSEPIRSRSSFSMGRPGSSTSMFSAGTFLTQTGPGYRDLVTKYYGEHLVE